MPGMGVLLASPIATLMEVFLPTSGPSALLVHHADQATRDAFANWLRRNSGTLVVCKPRNGTPTSGRIFPVQAIFTRVPVPPHAIYCDPSHIFTTWNRGGPKMA